ncbi:unnamed protein product [Rotaria sp. Silwood2]|nr:unnamed protein product [Rotaria sp. Silwood2]
MPSSTSKQSGLNKNLKDIIDKIFVSQSPILFTQIYEEIYSITIPEDKEFYRQRFLYTLERKYNQFLSSRHLHRCMTLVIANHVVQQPNPKIILIDDVENLIRQLLTFIKVACVEHLDTFAEIEENITLYINLKHIEQPYFALSLAHTLSPYLHLSELQLLKIKQISKLLNLVNVNDEEHMLSILKLRYIPSSNPTTNAEFKIKKKISYNYVLLLL